MINTKIKLVPILINPEPNETNPEYVTLIFDNVSQPHLLSNILKFSYYMNKPVYIFKYFKKFL